MPTVIILNLNQKIQASSNSKSVLNHILESHIDWLHSCGTKGRCTTCKMIVRKGHELLTPPTSAEQKFTALGALKDNERLACQCRFAKRSSETELQDEELHICVAQENKLPHLTYSDCEKRPS